MKRQLLIMTVLLGLFALCTVPIAQAQDGCGGGWGCDSGYGWLYNSLRYEVPHFAAFPPVYYSVPVPRTYGYSPFAYPPYIMTPEVAGEAQPLTIDNPYVPSAKPASTKPASANSKSDRSAATRHRVEPLVIINPFVTQSRTVAQSQQ